MSSSICAALEASMRAVPEPAVLPEGAITARTCSTVQRYLTVVKANVLSAHFRDRSNVCGELSYIVSRANWTDSPCGSHLASCWKQGIGSRLPDKEGRVGSRTDRFGIFSSFGRALMYMYGVTATSILSYWSPQLFHKMSNTGMRACIAYIACVYYSTVCSRLYFVLRTVCVGIRHQCHDACGSHC